MLFKLVADMAVVSWSSEKETWERTSLALNYDCRHRACQFGHLIDAIGRRKVCTFGF
jgi:hypothetical protein